MAKCSDCGVDPIPMYEGGIHSGFCRPTPARTSRHDHHPAEKSQQGLINTPSGFAMTAADVTVCGPCYVKAFAEAYPDQPAPRMPRTVNPDDEQPQPLQAPRGHASVSG